MDVMINRTIRALLAIRDMDPDTFRARAGLPKTTYYNRMSGRNGWSAAEVKLAADALGVSVGTLYEGLRLPHVDSNHEPVGLRTRHLAVVSSDTTQHDMETAA